MGSGLRSALVPALFGALGAKPRRGSPAPPGLWVPVQQVPGWTVQYGFPLPPTIVDDGSKWVVTDHPITGLDTSLYLLFATVRAASMPASFPLRVSIPVWNDTKNATPGVDQAIATTFQIDTDTEVVSFTNADPPTTEFAGQPFEIVVVPKDSGDGTTGFAQVGLSITPMSVIDGGPTPPQIDAISFRWEVQGEDGVWRLVQQAPGVVNDDLGNLTNTGTTFGATNLPALSTHFVLRYTEQVERATIPMRVTMLAFSVSPDSVTPGTIFTPTKLHFNNSQGAEETVFDGPTEWPINSFPGGPFLVDQIANSQPAIPPSEYFFGTNFFEAGWANSADLEQMVISGEFAVEVQLPPP